jgi:hypothetical protein
MSALLGFSIGSAIVVVAALIAVVALLLLRP